MTDRAATVVGGKLRRAFVTSEGVDLRLQLGSAGERAMAFVIDGTILFITLIVLQLLLTPIAGGGAAAFQVANIVWLLGAFVIRNGYFIAFELGMRAATPGKRIMKLRVVARDGGRLTGEAVIARNLMRELEFFLPLSYAFSGTAGDSWFDFGAKLASGVVVLAFLLFPLLNRDRLRIGDLIAGTWVVQVPRHALGSTIGEPAGPIGAAAPRYVFTEAQLAAYGEFELQKLEEVLRRADELSVIVVAGAIRGRIVWPEGGRNDDYAFLQAYYTALCTRLERNMLFGKRRADKHHAG